MRNDSPAKADSGITDLERQRSRTIPAGQTSEVSEDFGSLGSAGWRGAWTRFWFTPTAPIGLHWLRVLAGLLFLSWLLPLTAERSALFGLGGWFDTTGHIEASRLPGGPPVPIGWSLLYVDDPTALECFWWGAIVVLVLFTLGIATRITGVLTWLVVVSFLASPAAHSDTDYVLPILAFYLMLAHALLGLWHRRSSVAEQVLGPQDGSVLALFSGPRTETPPSYAANFAIRLVQIHFAIIVVSSGLHKLQLGDWWRGAAYWYPLHPPLEMTLAKLRAEQAAPNFLLFCLSLGSYLAVAWQLAFPMFAFRRRWRPLLLVGGGIAALGAVFMYGELTFGPAYAVFCLSYLSADEWQWLTDRLVRPLVSRSSAEKTSPVERKSRVKAAT